MKLHYTVIVFPVTLSNPQFQGYLYHHQW